MGEKTFGSYEESKNEEKGGGKKANGEEVRLKTGNGLDLLEISLLASDNQIFQ
jgi:hypothetical protein